MYKAEDIVKETSGGVATDYLHGIEIDDPVMLARSGTKSYYFGDGLGSIREMTDATGTVLNSYSYGAWGELRAQSVTVPNSYGYTGREFAEESLYYYRARYLDSSLGRFISEDPLSIMIIQRPELNFLHNLYPYVESNPTNYYDPLGLKLCIPSAKKENWKILESQVLRYNPTFIGFPELFGGIGICKWDEISWVRKSRWIQPGEYCFYLICNRMEWFWQKTGETYEEKHSGVSTRTKWTRGVGLSTSRIDEIGLTMCEYNPFLK